MPCNCSRRAIQQTVQKVDRENEIKKQKEIQRLRKEYEDNFKQILESGIENKEIKSINPDIIVFTMLTTLRSLYLWIPKKEELKIDELTASLSTVLLQGININ